MHIPPLIFHDLHRGLFACQTAPYKLYIERGKTPPGAQKGCRHTYWVMVVIYTNNTLHAIAPNTGHPQLKCAPSASQLCWRWSGIHVVILPRVATLLWESVKSPPTAWRPNLGQPSRNGEWSCVTATMCVCVCVVDNNTQACCGTRQPAAQIQNQQLGCASSCTANHIH